MASTRELKGRINSVHSSQKITGAMKMIASARLRKAENALYNTRPYLEEIRHLLDRVTAQGCNYLSPLAGERKLQRIAVVVFGSDDGLCGAFNLSIYKKLLGLLGEYRGKLKELPEVYPIGKKIRNELNKSPEVKVMDLPQAFAEKAFADGILSLADELMRQYLAGDIDRVEIVYAHFKSIGTQVMTTMQLLPWVGEESEGSSGKDMNTIYIFEPDCTSILEMLYPLAIRSILHQALLENQASEQAARILSMQMANDNALKLLKDLQLEYNKLRQQGITTELLDIAGGAIE